MLTSFCSSPRVRWTEAVKVVEFFLDIGLKAICGPQFFQTLFKITKNIKFSQEIAAMVEARAQSSALQVV